MATSKWVLLVYLFTMASLAAFAGSVATRVGPGRLFKAACVACCVVDAASAAAPGIAVLTCARGAAGAASACIAACFQLLQPLLAAPAVFPRIFALQIFAMGAASIAAPIVVGTALALGTHGWRVVYGGTAAVAALCAALAVALVPATPRNRAQRLDIPGFLLFSAAVASLVVLAAAVSLGWPWYAAVACAVALAVALLALARVETSARTPAPLFPPKCVLRRDSAAFLTNTLLTYGAFYSAVFLLPFLLRYALRLDALPTALAAALVSLGTAATALLLGRRVRRAAARPVYAGAHGILACGAALQAAGAMTGRIAPLFVGFLLMGSGIGLFGTVNYQRVHAFAGADLPLFVGLIQAASALGQALLVSAASAAFGQILRAILRRAVYDPDTDADGALYAQLYGRAVGVALLILCGVFILPLALLCCSTLPRPRGALGEVPAKYHRHN